jgi:hypothetical protein
MVRAQAGDVLRTMAYRKGGGVGKKEGRKERKKTFMFEREKSCLCACLCACV